MSFLYKNNGLLFFHFFVHAMPIDMHTHLYLYLCSFQHIKVQIVFCTPNPYFHLSFTSNNVTIQFPDLCVSQNVRNSNGKKIVFPIAPLKSKS